MTEVLHSVPHDIAWSYAHKMYVSDVMFSILSKRLVIVIRGCTIETTEPTAFLTTGMRILGVKESFELGLKVRSISTQLARHVHAMWAPRASGQRT